MLVKEDKRLQELVNEEKSKITVNTEKFARFLAYTHDDGPDDVEVYVEPERRGIRKLKGTPVWMLLWPARQCYHGLQFLYVHGIVGLFRKIKNSIHNNKWTRRKEARKFLAQIMPSEEEKKKQQNTVFSDSLKISVLVPLYNTPERFLRDMIESVTGQTYQNWELCLADASDTAHSQVAAIVKEYADKDSRIVYRKLEENGGIADNTNACIKMASGEYLALFDHDDILHPSALYECAKVISEQKAEFVYTDEVTFEGEKLENIITYHFKPDFSVDNLRGVNYICHLSVFKKELTNQVGMFSKEYDGSQDHDIIMRLTDAANHVCHVPKVLYFWRCHKMSTSMNLDSKSYAIAAGRRAVRDAEARRGYPAEVHSAQICKTHYRMKYEIPNPMVTIIIDGNGSREKAAHTSAYVEKYSSYSNYEIRCAMSVKEIGEEIKQAQGEYIVLLAAGAEIITPSWVEELLMFAQRTDVGAVGMQVLDEKELILSSDLVIGDTKSNFAIEVNRGERYDAPGYMGRNYYAHNISAISGAACMLKKETLESLWVEKDALSTLMAQMFSVCLKLRENRKQIVLNPYALCQIAKADYHGEITETDIGKLLERHGSQMKAKDPFYNQNLSFERYWQKK